MKANELRIGNFVYDAWSNEIFCLDALEFKVRLLSDLKDNKLEPIELTEEWFIKFGFEEEIDGYSLNPLTIGKYWIRHNFQQLITTSELKYVHQLQNLYFALTGNELKIKE